MFVIFFSGERAKNKILKICDAFGANRYPFIDDLGKQFQMITEVHSNNLMFHFTYSEASEHCNLVDFMFHDFLIMQNAYI